MINRFELGFNAIIGEYEYPNPVHEWNQRVNNFQNSPSHVKLRQMVPVLFCLFNNVDEQMLVMRMESHVVEPEVWFAK